MQAITWDSNDARVKWRGLADLVHRGEMVITRYRKPAAVVSGYEDWLDVQEELDDLRAARRAVEAVEEWERNPSTAKPWNVFKAELKAEGLLDADA